MPVTHWKQRTEYRYQWLPSHLGCISAWPHFYIRFHHSTYVWSCGYT